MPLLLMAISTDRPEIVWGSSFECLMRLFLLDCKMNTTHRKSLQNENNQEEPKNLGEWKIFLIDFYLPLQTTDIGVVLLWTWEIQCQEGSHQLP